MSYRVRWSLMGGNHAVGAEELEEDSPGDCNT
jgi:hypothetical protein